jgi:hypothetical protein
MNACCEPCPAAEAPGREDAPSLRQLLRRHARGLALTYLLFAVENVLALLQPLLLGLAVRGVIEANLWPALLFLGEIAASTAVGSWRRCYDARFFSRVYGAVAGDWAIRQRARGRELAPVAARAVLARQVVDFLGRDLPLVVQVVFQVVGAALLLLLNDGWLLVGCVLAAAVFVAQCPGFARRSQEWNRRLHDRLETEVEVLRHADASSVRSHYATLGRCQVGLADLQARQLVLAQGLTVLLTGFALYAHAGCRRDLSQVVALFGYLQMFSVGLLNLSPWLQQCLRLRDVVRRLHDESHAGPAPGCGERA